MRDPIFARLGKLDLDFYEYYFHERNLRFYQHGVRSDPVFPSGKFLVKPVLELGEISPNRNLLIEPVYLLGAAAIGHQNTLGCPIAAPSSQRGEGQA